MRIILRIPTSDMRRYERQPPIVFYLVGPAIILLVWSIASSLSKESELYLASPKETLTSFLSFLSKTEFYFDILYTLVRSLAAVVISVSLAIPVALVISLRKSLFVVSEFVIDFFRSIPSTALFPLFLVMFGINDIARTGTAVFICFWVILLNLLSGIFHTSQVRIEALTVVGANKTQVFRHVLFWESLAPLIAGIRLAITTSLVIIILTEMLVSPRFGLGARIFFMQQTYKIPEMYALIFVTGIIGYILNKLIVVTERKIIHWTKH